MGKAATDRDAREEVAARIKRALVASGLSQAELARAMGVNDQRVSSWVKGDALPNTPRLWRTLCDTLGVSADYILFGVTRGMDKADIKRLLR